VFTSDRILALDIGASKLVLAEFSTRNAAVPELLRFGMADLGVSLDKDSDPSAYIVAALRDLIKTEGFHAAPLLMTLPGQAVFPRYVKLPPVGRDKIQQMIRYEAEQNVPFPISEVVWDYQLVGNSELGEQDVLLVAVKTESVVQQTDCVQAAGLDPEIVDVAPLALYNCVRFNYADATGCTMVLDIGARNTNLLCIEENRIFSRSIPVAGNNITQEIAKSFQVDFAEAERLKCRHAFVALGGVYAPNDDPTADRISKIVRNVVTRLHAEVNRSINFYRSQQSGAQPERILLTGGSAVIPYMDTFFREKLHVDVDLLNPFINVAVSESLDTEAVTGAVLHLGAVAGLALRRGLSCPIEINLMPPDLVRRKTLERRLPYFGLAAVGLVLTLATWALHAGQMRRIFEEQQQAVEREAVSLRRVQEQLDRVLSDQSQVQRRIDTLREVVAKRTYWAEMLDSLRAAMLPGMWLTLIEPVRDDQGNLTHLRLNGRGFRDAMDRESIVGAGQQLTAVERLRDQLNDSPYFSGAEIVNLQEPEVFLREFVLRVGLTASAERK
jgi:type IV pilus assembly protein PilM